MADRRCGGKVVQFFAYPKTVKRIKLLAVLRTDKLLAAGCDAPEAFPVHEQECEPFHCSSARLAEQYGIGPKGTPG
jgi:hypothetical protein